MRDPSGFRDRFERYKEGEMPYENGLPKYRNGKIGHNVSHAEMNDDGTFTDDYTKVFEDMYVTPQKTNLKRGSYTLNNFPYYLQHRTDWMKPFMSSGTNEKGLELVNPEFDILLGGRLLATDFVKQINKTNLLKELQNIINLQFENKENANSIFDSYAKEYFNNMTTFKTPFRVGERNMQTVGDVVDFNYGLYGGRDKLLSELTPNLRYSLAKLSLLGEDRPSMNMLIHMDDSGLLPVNRYGFVPKDATNSKSIWNSSLLGEPEIWWNKGSAYYSPYGYPTIKNIPRTIVANLLKLSEAGINLTGRDVMHGPGVVPFESIEYGLQPNEFGWIDTIKFKGYKNGKLPGYADGKIHIKPANRGKFTALKKRTGHSASWFKENGTPAQKKMAVFALNAKKWKH